MSELKTFKADVVFRQKVTIVPATLEQFWGGPQIPRGSTYAQVKDSGPETHACHGHSNRGHGVCGESGFR